VSVTHSSNEHLLAFAIVRKFRTDASTTGMVFPWSLWAIDLGVGVWTANSLGNREAVSLGQLSGHFILAPIVIQQRATVAFDHDTPEDDVEITNDTNDASRIFD